MLHTNAYQLLLRRTAIIWALFFLGLGVFYAGSKFNVPWYGSNDFRHYSKMVENPIDAEIRAPFGYRVITPMAAHLVWRSGLYYESARTPFKDKFTSFDSVLYDPSILSALIFTNFLFLVFSAFFLIEALALDRPRDFVGRDYIEEVVFGGLVFLSFSTVVFGFAGITEGGTLFFVALLLYLHKSEKRSLFLIVVTLSVLQRELIPVVIGVYLLALGPRRNKFYLVAASAAFMVYLLIRRELSLPGHEGQLQVASYLENISSFSLTKEFVLQGLLANNLPIAFLALVALYRPRELVRFIPYFIVVTALLILSIGTDIGPNTGRILNIALPVFLLALGELVLCEKRNLSGGRPL
jgi:hypothetical protein